MTPSGPEIRIFPTTGDLFRAAADAFVARCKEAVAARGVFNAALSGGKTPRGLYTLLAEDAAYRERIAWDRVHLFLGDERLVPPDHADSNYRMVWESLLSKVPIPPWHMHRYATEVPDPEVVASYAEKTLRDHFRLAEGELPRFDLALLGMGPDGHTASLFPHTAALSETRRICVANFVEKLNAHRVTLTARVFNNAGGVILLVAGEDKARTLSDVLEGGGQTDLYPVQAIHPASGGPLWMIERAAAGLLKKAGGRR